MESTAMKELVIIIMVYSHFVWVFQLLSKPSVISKERLVHFS